MKGETKTMASQIKFGTDGWRAIIAKEFTFENAELVIRAIAQYIIGRFGTSRPVIVGHDLRFLAPEFAKLAAETLTQYGLKVELTDQYHPTPAFAYVAKYHESAGALVFTASHNPPEYMGIKFIPEYAGPAMPDITDVIVANVRALENDRSLWKKDVIQETTPNLIEIKSPRKEFVDAVYALVDTAKIKASKPLKVLFDPMYGCAQDYVDTLLKDLGHQVETIHDGHNPGFGGRMPEPIDEFLPELMQRVPAEKFDIGLASDGDGDRFGVVDERGRFLGANEIIPMVFRHLYKNKGLRGKLVRSLATSKLLDRLAEKYGPTEVIETPVGFKWMGQAMREHSIIVGGEQSGGFSIMNHIPEKDGVLAALVIVEMMCYEQKPLGTIYDETLAEAEMDFYPYYENFHITDEQKKATVDALKNVQAGQSFAGLQVESTSTMDGIKLNFSQYEWLTVRASGTEPVLRVYLETNTADKTKALKQALLDLINKQPALTH